MAGAPKPFGTMSVAPTPIDQDVIEAPFLGAKLRLRQPAQGYRAGLDAVLLAAAVTGRGRVMDAGCGAGAALLAAAVRCPDGQFVGVEREPAMAALAMENASLNGLAGRVEILCGDALAQTGAGFDEVFVNPPYDDGRLGEAPAPARLHAHVTEFDLRHWVGRLADALAGGGVLTMIHRADQADAVLAAFSGRLGGVCLRPIHPKSGAAAHRILVRGRKGSRARIVILPGLIAHALEGAAHPDIAACLTGDAGIGWD
jgi:tRNA1(Val) A37 N6-methylase TrmN6